MSYLHDDLDDEAPHTSSHRELTLSTGNILGIFFSLTLLCALFFGFGYNMGSKSRQAPIISSTTAPANPDFSSFKPSSGTPAGTPPPAYTAPKTSETFGAPASTSASTQPAPIVRTSPQPLPVAPSAARPVEPPTSTHAPVPASEAGINFIVQVAAVSHQEDADLLVAALKRKGYAVNARSEPQDKLFHIQVGPFPSKRDADAMRQRLQVDGYNAIVK